MKDTAFQRASPVLLSSSVSIASGNVAAPNLSELAYPFRKAVLIDEIRFDLRATAAVAVNLGSITYAKFQLGQHYLMRDAVPIWLLGTLMATDEEEGADTTLSTVEAFSHYRWRLPEPLYIEAGQVLRPQLSHVAHNTAVPAGNITAQVSYAGRVVPPGAERPRKIDIPYVAPFVTAFGNTYQQSNENHLFNPFDKPLLVQRLTARVLTDATEPVRTRSFTPAPGGTAQAQMQLDDSWGGKIVRDLTGIGDVCDELRAAWTFDTVMPAKGQYLAKVWNIQTNTQVHVAMIGTRQEFLP